MFARLFTRAPRAFNAARFNSTSSATRTSRLAEMAASAEKPTAAEASVPLLWGAVAAAAVVSFNKGGDKADVEQLIVV